MGYTALYRKFRPQTFEEIFGQEHITKTLKNQLIANRVGHAYLLTGSRGTGKTSVAKILARAINCLNPKDGEPCNECEICKAALNGSLTDIVEMDAASNNSVEDIRAIRDEVNFLPTVAKYRVYIIDEVHMLSTGAFNALLKTLEEPPEHVKFILATTEPQKLPATILSRCQRFDYKKISVEDITKKLEIICKECSITISPEALRLIAVLAEGGMRDAISILERNIQDGENEITEEKVKDLVGIPKLIHIRNITDKILENKPDEALTIINEVISEGKNLENFLLEIIKYLRDILILKSGGVLEIYSKEEIAEIEKLSKSVEKEKLLKLIYILSELENNMKYATQKSIIFQAGIIRASMKEESNTLEERISDLEEKMKNGKISFSELPSSTVKTEEKPKAVVDKIPKKEETVAKSVNNSSGNLVSVGYWKNVIEALKKQGKMTLFANLLNTTAKEINDVTLGIEFPNGLTTMVKALLERHENMQEIVRLVSIEAGKEMRVKILEGSKENSKKEENTISNLGININIIDE